MRFAVAPEKGRFVASVMNWVDLLAIVPYAVTLLDTIVGSTAGTGVGVNALGLLRVMRLVKLIRSVCWLCVRV